MRRLLLALALLPAVMRAESLDKPEERIIVRSPNHSAYASWTDMTDNLRRIEVKTAPSAPPVFSEDTVPRWTKAAWNPSSTRCLIGDAPNNGNVHFWLISQDAELSPQWTSLSLDLLAALSAAHYKLDPEVHHAFRPALVKIAWISVSLAQVRVDCREGSYLLTLDATDPKKAPTVKKFSDKELEE